MAGKSSNYSVPSIAEVQQNSPIIESCSVRAMETESISHGLGLPFP